MKEVFLALFLTCIGPLIHGYVDEKEEKLPSKCHVCKHMTREMSEELGRSGKSHDVLYIGHVFQQEPKKVEYRRSELRLTEALEDACSNVLEYKVHKDKPLAFRYEKVESVTFKTLKGLRNRGVKVDLGYPYQMWDTPDAEVARLKNRCEHMVEQYEDEITDWYWNHPDDNLTQWLCVERVLDPSEEDCLNETMPEKKGDEEGNSMEGTDKEMKEGTNGEHVDQKPHKTKATRKQTKEKKKSTGKKKTSFKGKKEEEIQKKEEHGLHDGESDSEKIQRLIREQSEKQARGRLEREYDNDMNEDKRERLQGRLIEIDDPTSLRREIRKIRQKELTEDDYSPKEPWEGEVDPSHPDEVNRHMRQRRYEQVEDADDFRREIEMRFHNDRDFDHHSVIRQLLHQYLEEAETIRDAKELRERLEDLDVLSAIFARGRKRHDEL